VREVVERCCAKLNLFLDVVGRRHDGFHELVTVFHEIDLADELIARELPGSRRDVRIRVEAGAADADHVPAGPGNLAAAAARALLDATGTDRAVELVLRKNVPTGAGLGGGSADAAGALRAVERLLELDVPPERLEEIGASVGSDVAFLVRGGTALGRGRGELLEPVPAAGGMSFLLLVPSFGIATPDVFRALPRELSRPVPPDALLTALAAGDAAALAASTHNALLEPALRVEPRLATLLSHLRAELGPQVQLTGSGSTLFLPTTSDTLPDTGGWPFATRAILARSK
jgi:4-diphosphocytidyl-2-C-methyl-D-erythritol kinase